MFIALIVTLISLILLIDFSRKKRRADLVIDLPGPKPFPIIGNALLYWGKSPEDIFQYIANNKKKYGRLYRVWIFNQLAVFSSNPKDIEVVLASPKYITKNTLYDFLHDWLGTGLLLTTGPKWHSRRKILTPAFHFKILEEFIEIFDQQSDILVKNFEKHLNIEAFDIHPYITLQALDVVSETAMGTKIYAQTDPNCAYVHAVAEVTHILTKKFINVWYRIEWIFKIFAAEEKRKLDAAIKVLHDFTERIIEDRRRALEDSKKITNKVEAEEDDIGTKKKMALLDILLQSTSNGKPLTNEDIREEVDAFMFAGHDTTTTAICFVLYCISRHPEVQEKLFAEIRNVIGDDKTKRISYRELQDLKYMECAIKESLRLYPSVPIIGRLFTEDVILNGKIIPAGTNYTVGIYVMHRDPEIFPEPDKFNPDRHTIDNSTEKSNPYAYIPFSAGPRNCIGQKFAMLEMKSTVSKILRNYELLPLGPDPRPIMNLVMRSYNGVHLGIKPRVYI